MVQIGSETFFKFENFCFFSIIRRFIFVDVVLLAWTLFAQLYFISLNEISEAIDFLQSLSFISLLKRFSQKIIEKKL